MSCNNTQRYGIKQIDGVPTIPVSSDHRNGDWIATDIYQGEFAQDTNTGAVHTRAGAETVSTGAIPNQVMVLKARVYQVGTGAPTLVEYYNPFGYTLTTIRDAAGIYRIQGFTTVPTSEDFNNTLNNYEMYWSPNALLAGSNLDIYPAAATEVVLRSYDNTGTLGDNIIGEFSGGTSAIWNVITIMRYKV